MMTHELEVSIVAAPLEAIDRRALSQAWYSALHLASPARRSRSSAAMQRRPPMPATYPSASVLPRALTTAHLRPQLRQRATAGGAFGGDPQLPGQVPHSRLAVRIERVFAAASIPKRATFSLGRGSARVHVVLQTTPTRTMLVALCRPELRADVGQALAQARAALAARGIALDLRKLGGPACF
ncbi:MAG TPA: hypothetical protein VKR05_03580 [Candidatus Cybelea sp.]|nr:hypothetical protein [Candidatus Cybelea sp.]